MLAGHGGSESPARIATASKGYFLPETTKTSAGKLTPAPFTKDRNASRACFFSSIKASVGNAASRWRSFSAISQRRFQKPSTVNGALMEKRNKRSDTSLAPASPTMLRNLPGVANRKALGASGGNSASGAKRSTMRARQ